MRSRGDRQPSPLMVTLLTRPAIRLNASHDISVCTDRASLRRAFSAKVVTCSRIVAVCGGIGQGQ